MKDLIDLDKSINHALGGYHNQTISRNVGSKIARQTGMSVNDGTDLFHAGLFVVGGAGLLYLLTRK